MKETCSNCRWYFEIKPKSDKHPGGGQCRVHAPAVGFVAVPKMSVESGGLVPSVERCSAFPIVEADVWCGEHEPKGQS